MATYTSTWNRETMVIFFLNLRSANVINQQASHTSMKLRILELYSSLIFTIFFLGIVCMHQLQAISKSYVNISHYSGKFPTGISRTRPHSLQLAPFSIIDLPLHVLSCNSAVDPQPLHDGFDIKFIGIIFFVFHHPLQIPTIKL